MQHFYDGQIRRYLTQTIRVFSNFVVKYGDGTLHRVPVLYGDADRQVANIIRQNSENKLSSVPRISVYITGLSMDKERLSDATYVGKVHIRERGIDGNAYNNTQGRNYTVERIMPTPFKLSMKVDIWTASTDQKLQLMEQILVLFNPNLELQTNDNYVDWTSLTLLTLGDINWSSKQVPVGVDTPIDIGTLTLETPIWLSPPAKVKHLGVITKVITSVFGAIDTSPTGYIDGLGVDLADSGTTSFSDLLATEITTITNFNIEVYNSQVILLNSSESVIPREPTLDIGVRQGTPVNWQEVLDQYPGQYTAGSSRIFLTQPNGYQIVGTVALDPVDNTILSVSWDVDSLLPNTGIDSQGRLDTDVDYDAAASYRPASPGTFDAIIDPLTYNPKRPLKEEDNQPILVGIRYLIIEDIGNIANMDGADAWKSLSNVDFIAHANDIIEWSGTAWHVIFDSIQETDTMIWQTNIYTGVQYLWNGVSWVKSFEGVYNKGSWRLEL
jgi:hypothetical protein